jgi:hypothetical protein
MSGLKINYHKSEMIVIGASKEACVEFVDLLNCREGKLPIKYPGIPV